MAHLDDEMEEVADVRGMDPLDVAESLHVLTDATTQLLRSTQIPRRHLPTPSYDGSQDLEDFLASFQQIGELNGWSTEEIPIRLKNAISGKASQGLSGCHTTAEIFERLRARYELTEQGARQLLRSCVWKEGEDVYQFTDYLRKLLPKALPELDEPQVEARIIKELLASLPPRLNPIAWELQQRPRDELAEILRLIHQFEQTVKPPTHVKKLQEAEVTALQQQVQQLGQQLQQQAELMKQMAGMQALLQQQMQTPAVTKPPRKPMSEVECYKCHQKGHVQRNCPLNQGN